MIKRLVTVLVVLSILLIENTGTYCPNDKEDYSYRKNAQTVLSMEDVADKQQKTLAYTPASSDATINKEIESTGLPERTPAGILAPSDATIYKKEIQSNGSSERTPAISPGTKPNAAPTSNPTAAVAVIKGLVELLKLDSSFVIDLKYASTDNFTGKKIYTQSKCILNENTAAKLIKANDEFKKLGYKIKIYDAYRPHSAQKVLWDAASDKSFVADPKKGSVHNRGAAVDITLVDKSGTELKMPSKYDEFTKRARLDYKDCPEELIKNRELLGKTMVKYGFKRISNEWWHFDDTDAKKYPIKDIPFESF